MMVSVIVIVEFMGEELELTTRPLPEYLADLLLMELAREHDLKIVKAKKQRRDDT